MLPPKERQLPSECTLLRKEFFGLREKIPTMYVGIFVTFGILLKDNLRILQNFVYKAQIVFLFFFFLKQSQSIYRTIPLFLVYRLI